MFYCLSEWVNLSWKEAVSGLYNKNAKYHGSHICANQLLLTTWWKYWIFIMEIGSFGSVLFLQMIHS